MSVVAAGLAGAPVDGSWFTAVTDLAKDTRWLNGPVEWWTNAGLAVYALLMVAGWWQARRRDARAMALALAGPVCVLVAFAVAEVVKKIVAEPRPCLGMSHAFIVEACPAPSDYAFPSGHMTVAAAASTALFLLDRRLGAISAVFALIEAFTRVYVGAHYPHDVAGSVLLAIPVALALALALGRVGAPLVARARGGVLAPVLVAAGADAPAR
jgi:membrane-associated phospholipid phosphatase